MTDDQDAPHELITTWFVDGVPRCEGMAPPVDPGATAGEVRCTAALDVDGTIPISLWVKDVDGLVADTVVSIEVGRGTPPEVRLIAPTSGTQLRAGVPVELQATAVDAEDDAEQLDIVVQSDREGVLAAPPHPTSTGQVSGTIVLAAVGEHLVTVTATDSTGLVSSDQALVQVVAANSDPTCAIVAPADGSAAVLGSNVTLEAEVADPDGDPLTATFSFLGTARAATVANGRARLTTDQLTAGPHDIALAVEDGAGGRCADTITIDIGQAPTVQIVSPASDGLTFSLGAAIALEAQVGDPDDGNPQGLEVTWTSDVAAAPSPVAVTSVDASGNSGSTTAALPRGSHQLTASVASALGLIATDRVLVDVNGPPERPTVKIAPSSPTSVDELTLVVTTPPGARDLDGDTVTYRFTWSRNGLATSTTSSTVPAADTARGQSWSVEVTPVDEHGLTGPTATATVSIGDSLPTVSGVVVLPDPAYADDELTCAHDPAVDADGDVTSVRYAWTVGGAPAGSASTLASTATAIGDVVTCTVIPTGTRGDGAATTSMSIIVGNRVPQIASARIEPTDPTVEDVLRCVHPDPVDDGPVTVAYAWSIGGSPLPGRTAPELPAGVVARGDRVTCTVTPSDGASTGAGVTSRAVTIDNVPPVAPVPEITPTLPGTESVLTCSLPSAIVDADGDPTTALWGWRIDGDLSGVTDATLPSSETRRGQSVTCFVQPDDGFERGEVVSSAPVDIMNTPPTAVSVSVSPSAPTAATALVAMPVGFADVDGDLPGWRFRWEILGVEVGTGSTLPAGTAARGETVALTAWPFDGEDEGLPVTASTVPLGNAAPSAPVVSVSPTAPRELLDDLVCAIDVASIDPDGDAVSYAFAWTVDGEAFAGATNGALAGDTVPAAAVGRDRAWVCSVTPSDATDAGEAGTARATSVCVVRPLACDGFDDDCDGDASDGFADRDADGLPDCVDDDDGDDFPADQDCDDERSDVYPGAPEIPDDGVDQDCNTTDTVTCFVDADLDGFGVRCPEVPMEGDPACTLLAADGDCDDDGESAVGTDCDDGAPLVKPDAVESCNGIDDDCDEVPDNGLTAPAASKTKGVCAGAVKVCAGAGGWIDPDFSAIAHYEATETSCDGRDNDCDGSKDPMKRTRWRDRDKDGAGDTLLSAVVCPDDAAYVDNDDDCDDLQDWIAPGLDMMPLLSMFNSAVRDHLTTSDEGPAAADRQLAISVGYTNADPYIVGWSVRTFPPGYSRAGNGWVELHRPYGSGTNDHITMTDGQSAANHDHGKNAGYSGYGLRLGWVLEEDLGDYTRKFERFWKDEDQNHRMSRDGAHELELESRGFVRDGYAGFSFVEDFSCP